MRYELTKIRNIKDIYYRILWLRNDFIGVILKCLYYFRILIRKFEKRIRRHTPHISKMALIGSDVWNLDSSIADLVIYGTDWLLKHGQGYPGDLTPESWDEILKKINEGFKGYLRAAGIDDSQELVPIEEEERLMKIFKEETLPLFIKYYENLWD